MALLRLSTKERDYYRQIVKQAPSRREVRWAQVLLLLDRGETLQKIAAQFGVSRQAVHDRLKRYQVRSDRGESLQQRISHHPKKRDHVIRVLGPLLQHNPQQVGERSARWTISGLTRQVIKKLGYSVTWETVCDCLRRMDLPDKLPYGPKMTGSLAGSKGKRRGK